MNDIDTLASAAVQKVSAEGCAPTEAVRSVVEGRGFNRNKVSRICTKVNRTLLDGVKSSAEGMVWGERFETAKPHEVLGEAESSGGREMSASTTSKTSSVRGGYTSLRAAVQTLYSPVKEVSLELPERFEPESEKTSASSELELQEMLATLSGAVKESETTLLQAEFDYEQALSDLVMKVSRLADEESLTLGEALAAVKLSSSSEAFIIATDTILSHHNIDPEAVLGQKLSSKGEPDRAAIAAARRIMHVQMDKITDKLSWKVLLNKRSPLVKSAEAFTKAHEGLEVCREARNNLNGRLENWTTRAHDALYQ